MIISKKAIHGYQELFFDGFITLTYILIFLYSFGISAMAKKHLDIIYRLKIIILKDL